jgi:CO/xanthine dehydrogenase Mo-binding subunit
MASVGQNVHRKEGPDKLCGRAQYIDDLTIPGCLHGVTVRSSIPRGRIESIEFDPAFPWDECTVVTARDIPGENVVQLIERDQPLLADTRIQHMFEPIALIAHADRAMAYRAREHVRVRAVEEPAVLTMEDALAAKVKVYGGDNVFKRIVIERGDVEAALRGADVVVEGEYRVPHQEQTYIENNGIAAWFEPDGQLVVTGSMQCPYYVLTAMQPVFGLPAEKVRVVQTTTGGGFGGKEEYPNMIAGHAALLAFKAKRPVKIIYDRHEDMQATTKRHPAWIRHRTGIDRTGRLMAQDVEVLMDGGAYMTLTPVVLSRGALHATGPYDCPNVRVHARAVATNTPPNGAFRGFGAPQTLFAAELHWERIAAALGIDALQLRQWNLVRVGSTLPTGQVLRQSVGTADVLERCVESSGYVERRRENARWNRKRTNPTWRGIGISLVHHGAGFTGSGEVYLASRAAVALRADGRVRVEAASTEIGQGTNSMFAQIVADTLGLSYDLIDVDTPDTQRVPNSGPTVASRTCMIVGGLLQRACNDLRRAVADATGAFPTTAAGLRQAAKRLCNGNAERVFTAQYEPPPDVRWDDKLYRGDAYAVYGYAACAVDLEVDKLTHEVTVRQVVTANDIGKAIHPLLVEGQIMGGTLQALGWALLENVVYARGGMQNAQLTNYIIPTSMDTPPMRVELVENAYARGPFGAKGVGEIPMDVPAPAVAAAIHQATGALIPKLPILPEDIGAALRQMAREA